MWKYILVGAVGFGAGLFVAKMAYESKVRTGIGGALDTIGDKVGYNFRGGFIEKTVDSFAGV